MADKTALLSVDKKAAKKAVEKAADSAVATAAVRAAWKVERMAELTVSN